MDYTERLQNVSVLGAAGKMGSGILLLTAVEMADLSLMPENKDKQFILNAIDVSDAGLQGLLRYLKAQVLKVAEKKTMVLRELYKDRKDLVENGEIIEQYIFDVMSVVRPSSNISVAYQSNLVFEAASENPDLKLKLFGMIEENSSQDPWYFTNTSSIPINYLNDNGNLGGRVLGFHFYNPPAVQKLVEVIVCNETLPGLHEFALQYAKKLRKVVVPSNDFAGFIGNGHFMRDALHGIKEAQRLSVDHGFGESVYMVNKVAQDFLVRPMGIFQLIDYVGVEVCQYIMKVMNPYLKDEDLHSDLLDQLVELGVKGGQFSDGSQKDGFLKYERNRPVGIFDPSIKDYVAISDFSEKCDQLLGPLPDSHIPWKSALRRKDLDQVFTKYFGDIKTLETKGADLAKRYHAQSNAIGLKLVSDGVAANMDDVNKVMLTGFFHVYGPINNFLN